MTEQAVNLANVRALLLEGLDDWGLRRICFDIPDFQPAHDELARGTGRAAIVDRLLAHAEKTRQIPALLALAQALDPTCYQHHGPYYLGDPIPLLHKTLSDLARRLAALTSPAPRAGEQPHPLALPRRERGRKEPLAYGEGHPVNPYGPDLIGADPPSKEGNGARLPNVDGGRTSLGEIDLNGVDWRGADLSGADLHRANLIGACLDEANLVEANLVGANLSRANLSRANLSWANLCQADLTYTVLRRANLQWADLSRARLSEAILGQANLSVANLRRVSLHGADLSAADLTCADLTGTDLTDADLSGADLRKARVTAEQLARARSLEGATLPQDGIHEPGC